MKSRYLKPSEAIAFFDVNEVKVMTANTNNLRYYSDLGFEYSGEMMNRLGLRKYRMCLKP